MMTCLKVARNNFKRSCNRPTSFAANLIIPIFVVVLGISVNNMSQPGFTIGVINETTSTNLVQTLSNTNGITIVRANPDTVKIDLITGKYSAIIDLSKSNYTISSIKDNETNQKIEQIIDSYQSTHTPIDIETAMDTSMSLAERTTSFIVLFLMVTATVTASLMIKDKNNGMLKRYKYSPQNPKNYILGNIVYNYFITFFQFLICITFITVIGIDIGIGYLNLVFMGIWLSGIATAFGTFVSSIFKKEMYANLFASGVTLILSLIGGSFISYDNMPYMLQKISIISPLRWFIDITSNMEKGLNWFSNILQITILTGMIIALILITTYINKKTRAF